MELSAKPKSALILATLLLLTTKAASQEITAATDCSKYAPTKYAGDVECRLKQIEIIKRETDALKQQHKEAEEQIVQLRKQRKADMDATACIQAVMKDADREEKKGSLTPAAKARFKARVEKCDPP